MNEYSGNASSYAEDNLKAYSDDVYNEDSQYGIVVKNTHSGSNSMD
jgi:hypothetical protein